MRLTMPLKKNRKYGHKSRKHAYCPGYTDERGHWNNGFICPKWGEPDQQYCCGTDTHKFCCPEPTTAQPLAYANTHTSLLIGILLCAMALMSLAAFITCYICHGCPVHRKCRKRCQKGACRPRGQSASYLNRQFDFVIGGPPRPDQYYSGLVLANGDTTDLRHPGYPPGYPPPCYPADEYPNEYPGHIADSEKQPLTPLQDEDLMGELSETDIRVAMWLHHAGMVACPDSDEEPYMIYENSGDDVGPAPVHSFDRRYCLDDSFATSSMNRLKHFTSSVNNQQGNNCPLLSPTVSVKTM